MCKSFAAQVQKMFENKISTKFRINICSTVFFSLLFFFLIFFFFFFFFAFYKQTDFSTRRDMKMSKQLLFTSCAFLSLKNIKLLNFKSLFLGIYVFSIYVVGFKCQCQQEIRLAESLLVILYRSFFSAIRVDGNRWGGKTSF